jgi:uncharacterized membrane-anchored protein
MVKIKDHPKRHVLVNELHARPFPRLMAPAHAVYLAIKPAGEVSKRDREAERAHLVALLDLYGATHPAPGATHYAEDLGPFRLKWEQHTEFVTYTVFFDGLDARPFDPAIMDMFPSDWLANLPGERISSALIRVEVMEAVESISGKFSQWFEAESMASSEILDNSAIVAGDFRMDTAGHMRFAVFVQNGTGPQRIGRIVQRLCEVETYKTMAMLGLIEARSLSAPLGRTEQALENLTEAMAAKTANANDQLDALLEIASELESLLAQSSFRFSATKAYGALVAQRVEVMREERFQGRQTFSEFMSRRFDPAMRTVEATEARLKSMAERSARAGDLLRTRVDVERSAQNQTLLESMDQRAATQLRLQETVEGLSVVAISYYAVNLASYLFYPMAGEIGLEKPVLTAILTPAVILLVFLMVRRIRNKMH